jgi:2-polyprenyl-3-methyl-5-hydroxy-6-metoxy-1,4-benzoquinol methylase
LASDDLLHRIVRATVPFPIRKVVHRLRAEPYRIRDFVPDLVDRVRLIGPPPLPPPSLRSNVSWTTSRKEFLRVAREGSADVLDAFRTNRRPEEDYSRWFDFGCGCGRLSRALIEDDRARRLTGVDPDEAAVRWAAGHLRGSFRTIDRRPPTAMPAGSFDVAVAISVFTHMEESSQRAWLAELRRLLRPGGLFIVSTLGPDRLNLVPGLTEGQSDEFAARGFLFAPGGGAFNWNGAFHNRAFMEETWSPLFRLRDFRPEGMTRFQDLSVWEA